MRLKGCLYRPTGSLEVSLPTKSSALLFILFVLFLIGVAFTIHSTTLLSTLRQRHADLRMDVGLFEEGDASKVRVVRANVPEELRAPGIEDSIVWRFRISFPAHYEACYQSTLGLVKPGSPGGSGSSNTSFGSANPKPSEASVSLSFIKDKGEWICSMNYSGGATSLSVPPDFPIGSLENVVIEQVVDYGDSRSFDVDAPICLLRIRDKNLATNRDGTQKKGLYNGFSFYVFNAQNEKAFTAWAAGNTASMEEQKE